MSLFSRAHDTRVRQALAEQEQKLGQTLSELQQRVGIFRSQKELDEAGSAAGVDKELAAMKDQLALSSAPAATAG